MVCYSESRQNLSVHLLLHVAFPASDTVSLSEELLLVCQRQGIVSGVALWLAAKLLLVMLLEGHEPARLALSE